MPPKKQAPLKIVSKKQTLPKKPRVKKSAPKLVSEPITKQVAESVQIPVQELIVQEPQQIPQHTPEKIVIVQQHIHLRQAVFLSIGFMVLFTSLLFVSTRMKAQEYSASISAVVLATPLNTRPPKQPNWWEKIDPYTKLYGGTAIAGVVVIGLAALLLIPKKKKIITT